MPSSTDPMAAVRQANQAFYTAFEALDLEAMRAIWSGAELVSCIHPGWKLVEGNAAVMESWAGIFRGTESIHFSLRDIRVFVTESTAWVALIEEIETRQGDRVLAASAQATNVFVHEALGSDGVHPHAGPVLTGRRPSEPDIETKGSGDRTLH